MTDQTVQALGCGDLIDVGFALGRAHADQWVDVELHGPRGTQSARVRTDSAGDLRVGQGMCGGPFAMVGGHHTVHFTLLGPGGQRSKTVQTLVFNLYI